MTGDGKPRLINEGPFFAQLWESVLYDPNLKSTDKVVYAVLQRYASQFGSDSVFPSQETIANKIHMNREAVNVALQNLVTHGHISRERQGNVWIVTIHSPVGKPDKPVGKPDNWVLENPTSLSENPALLDRTQSNEENTENLLPAVVDKPFQMWAAFCEETKQDYTKATRQAKGYALSACKRLIEDGITADEVRAFVRFRTTTWKNDAVIRMSDVVKEIGEWRMAGEPAVDNAPRPAVHKNGNKGLGPRDMIRVADHMAETGANIHDAFSYIKGTK